MRGLFLSVLLFASAVCVGASYSQIKKIADDDDLLQNAGVSLSDVQFRLACRAAIVETSDPPEFSNYLFVQSSNELNLFSLENGALISEMQLKLRAIEGVAFTGAGANFQLQIFSHRRVIALFMDRGKVQAVYAWLADHEVPVREPLPPISTNVGTNPFRL